MNILNMTPATLRKELSHAMTVDPDLREFVPSIVGDVQWSKMSAYQYTIAALAWAWYNADSKNDKQSIQSSLDTLIYLFEYSLRKVENNGRDS